MKENNILCLPISATQVRMVTHLDVSKQMISDVLQLIESL